MIALTTKSLYVELMVSSVIDMEEPKPAVEAAPTTPLPKPALTETDAKALLAVSGLAAPKPQRLSKGTFIAIVVVVLIIISTILVVASQKSSKTNGASSIGLPGTNNNPINNGGSINQDEQYCANPVNATTSC